MWEGDGGVRGRMISTLVTGKVKKLSPIPYVGNNIPGNCILYLPQSPVCDTSVYTAQANKLGLHPAVLSSLLTQSTLRYNTVVGDPQSKQYGRGWSPGAVLAEWCMDMLHAVLQSKEQHDPRAPC